MDPVPELKEPKAGPGVSYSPVLDVEDLIRLHGEWAESDGGTRTLTRRGFIRIARALRRARRLGLLEPAEADSGTRVHPSTGRILPDGGTASA